MSDLREVIARAIAEADAIPTFWQSRLPVADAVLSALSDRSRSEVGGDVVRECAKIIGQALLAPAKPHNGKVDPIGALVPAAEAGAAYLLSILAAGAERRVRESIAAYLDKQADAARADGHRSDAQQMNHDAADVRRRADHVD